MKRTALLLIVLLFAHGCAFRGGVRRVATVTTVTAHTVLGALQDGERALVCGKDGAPAAPLCVEEVRHREISQHFVTAFHLDGQVLRTVRALPVGAPLPGEVPNLLGQIGVLIDTILAAIPPSPQKTQLAQKTIGGK